MVESSASRADTDIRKTRETEPAVLEAVAQKELERLRGAIDRLDEVLVRLLNQRALYAVEIGQWKKILAIPVYSPEREKDVLARVERCGEGPLHALTIRRLFERIIDESRRVEREVAGSEDDRRPEALGRPQRQSTATQPSTIDEKP